MRRKSIKKRRVLSALNRLRSRGRDIYHAHRRLFRKKKPFFFSGKRRRASRPIVQVKHVVIKEKMKPIIVKGDFMGRRKRKYHRSYRSRRYHGEFMGRRHRRSHRRYHGGFMGIRMPNIMSIVTEVGGVAGGAVGSSFVANMVPIANPKIKALIPLALGIVLSNSKLGKSGFGKGIALGSIAVGTISLVKQFAPQLPLLTGDAEVYGMLASPEERPMLGSTIEGDDGQYGYEVSSGSEVQANY
jgi:hypothetical protein